MSTTVRVSAQTHDRIAHLSKATGMQIQQVVDAAVSSYEAEVFWSAFERGYERLSDDQAAWSEITAERAGEAGALADGIGEAGGTGAAGVKESA